MLPVHEISRRRFSRTFEVILYRTLQREMGRRSFKDSGLSPFGARTIFVAFKFDVK